MIPTTNFLTIEEEQNLKIQQIPEEPYACPWRGKYVGLLQCGCKSMPKCFECTNSQQGIGYCTINSPGKNIKDIKTDEGKLIRAKSKVPACSICRFRVKKPTNQWKPGELRFIKARDLAEDTLKLLPYVPANCRGILATGGRSGFVPATILSTILHSPLGQLSPTGIKWVDGGSRSKFTIPNDGIYFVVDDSVYSGNAMRKARQALKNEKALFAAVYIKEKTNVVDHYAVLSPNHIFEWNIFNNNALAGKTIMPNLKGGFALDFDGILCLDTTFKHSSKNETEVIEWLRNASPKYICRHSPIELVVSFRLEKHREHIEYWLKKYGIGVNKLILHPANSFEERDNGFNVADHKGLAYKNSTCSLFFESDDRQAPVIAKTAGKPVIVPDSGKVYLP